MLSQSPLLSVTEYCRQVLSLDSIRADPTAYHSLSLCVIDAVYSIGARYSSTYRAVQRYCTRFNLPYLYQREEGLPPREAQESIPAFLERGMEHGVERFADEIFANRRQRTSTRGGILKADAVFRFAGALDAHGIHYLQDAAKALQDPAVEASIREIPGQRSGVSYKYFLMLAGSDDLIKPDRMIFRFLHTVLGRSVTMTEAEQLVSEAAIHLQGQYPHLTPKLLDNAIWQYQCRQ